MKKFSLRDVFWLVLVVALALAWWMDRRQLRRQAYIFESQATYLRDTLEREGFKVTVSPDGTAIGAARPVE